MTRYCRKASFQVDLGIVDRGVIRTGAFADLVLFDPASVADRSTIERPEALSVGIAKVWVNGAAVFAYGRPTGVYPGMPVRRDPAPNANVAQP